MLKCPSSSEITLAKSSTVGYIFSVSVEDANPASHILGEHHAKSCENPVRIGILAEFWRDLAENYEFQKNVAITFTLECSWFKQKVW